MKWYRAHFEKYLHGADIDNNYLSAPAGPDPGAKKARRRPVARECEAGAPLGLVLPTLMPGITINTGPTTAGLHPASAQR